MRNVTSSNTSTCVDRGVNRSILSRNLRIAILPYGDYNERNPRMYHCEDIESPRRNDGLMVLSWSVRSMLRVDLMAEAAAKFVGTNR